MSDAKIWWKDPQHASFIFSAKEARTKFYYFIMSISVGALAFYGTTFSSWVLPDCWLYFSFTPLVLFSVSVLLGMLAIHRDMNSYYTLAEESRIVSPEETLKKLKDSDRYVQAKRKWCLICLALGFAVLVAIRVVGVIISSTPTK